MRKSLSYWRTTLTGDIAKARQAFRKLLSGPTLFTPFVARGYHAIRFVGRIDFESVLGAEMVTNVACLTNVSWNQLGQWLRQVEGLRRVA